ncbi:deoxyribose-phosphate aldolase [Iamia sp. SCSIO 61187]|uniref:deoxyribose-phosphate aldolase n=1 Tax=Iamia sp. SCSIO 61187 TaxID=2722752 RepID=UPI001C62CD7C|nr:deoxyribose-phosphate aldolase [Iamia sp. SCSIO 61187]QYG93756.1 deoxyribose-phosphate aldolase [Iamia sp. SCSIO 61187]
MPEPLDRSAVARLIDHTLLAPTATSEEVAALCREGAELGVAAVCVSPSRLPLPVADLPPELAVAAVVGFPSGAHTPATKAREAADCVAAGATEIDMVIDLGAIAGGQWELAEAGVAAVHRALEGRALLKVILESAVLVTLGDDVLERACAISEAAGADFVKTSTGFHPAGGASTEAVARMRAAVGDRLGVKASGGIRDWATAVAMVEAGASRLGCSASRAILDGAPS